MGLSGVFEDGGRTEIDEFDHVLGRHDAIV